MPLLGEAPRAVPLFSTWGKDPLRKSSSATRLALGLRVAMLGLGLGLAP